MVTRPRLWLKTTSEKGPHLSCVVFTLTVQMHSTLLRSPCPRLCGVILRVNSTNVQTFSRASLEIILSNLSHPTYSHTHFLHSLSPCLRLCLLNSPLPPPSPYLLPPLPLPLRKLWTFPYPHFPCFRVKQPTHPPSFVIFELFRKALF